MEENQAASTEAENTEAVEAKEKEDVAVNAQPAEEAQPEQQQQTGAPKWVKIVGLVSIIAITAAGLLSALFLCLLSLKTVAGSLSETVMLSDVVKNIQDAAKNLADNASNDHMSAAILGEFMYEVLFNVYIMMGMIMGIITGIILGIMLIVKTIKQFAAKKEANLEKTAITACLFFFADAVIVMSLAVSRAKYGSFEAGTKYGGATLAGLIICGILFAVYFIGKIVANYKNYLGDKKALLNGCMNLGWAVIATLVLALLACAPVAAKEGGASYGYGFNYIFSDAFGQMLKSAEGTAQEILSSLAKRYVLGAFGMVIQIWFIFQTGKSLHGAMRGTVSADKAVKLGTQIWRLIFAVLYLIISAALTKEVFDGAKANLAAPVVILVFAIVGLVLSIVNKVLVKDKAATQEI